MAYYPEPVARLIDALQRPPVNVLPHPLTLLDVHDRCCGTVS